MTNPLRMTQIKNKALRSLVKKLSKIDTLEQWYDDWLARDKPQEKNVDKFLDYVLGRLNVTADLQDIQSLENASQNKPLIIVANHPLGGLEGMLLTQIIRRIRPDIKVLTNELLRIFPEFHDTFIGVNILTPNKQRENARAMRDIAQHLSNNGALLVFPAGTVSHLSLRSGTTIDAPWDTLIVRLARKYAAAILPVYIDAQNTTAFYLSGYIHKRLRTMLLPRAMIQKSNTQIPFTFGALIPAMDIQRLTNNTIATNYIRMCCEVLQNDPAQDGDTAIPHMNTIKPDIAPLAVSQHIESLTDCLIHEQNNFLLYCAPYDRLGPVMEQLAIEREKTFRQVDEGTGRELDSDRFDPHYNHLFIWDNDAQRIAGGYRLGQTDAIIKNLGIENLYSHSLFKYDTKFLHKMGKTIEVGRSFITPAYQRHPGALDILWKGIGRFVAQSPEYHTLFGCVSISSQYSKLATTLLSQTFLSHYGADDSVQRNIKARTPLAPHKTPWTKKQLTHLSDIPVINKLVGRIDSGKSIPVLIRHYLALNGRFMSFTVNTGFNHSLDGLIMVDLRSAPEKYLKRYMGPEGLKTFQSQWETKTDAA
jgi:putative hemolysin